MDSATYLAEARAMASLPGASERVKQLADTFEQLIRSNDDVLESLRQMSSTMDSLMTRRLIGQRTLREMRRQAYPMRSRMIRRPS